MYTMIDVKYTQEDFFMSAEFLDFILEVVISYLVPILELIGVFIVAYGTIKSFVKFIRSGLNSDDTRLIWLKHWHCLWNLKWQARF